MLLYGQSGDQSVTRPLYREFSAGALNDFAECLWRAEAPDAVRDYAVLPDGCIDIVYWPDGGLRVVGTMTERQTAMLPPGGQIIGVRFRPAMAGGFLGGVAPELVDRWTPLEDLWGARARRLHAQLDETAAAGRLAVLSDALPRPRHEPGPVHRAISAMVAAAGAIDLDWAARQARLSPRQFRRRTIEETGLSPKHLCRVLRFRRATSLAPFAARLGWAAVAAECGYSDQAHLIHDFREFSASTPAEFARDRFSQDAAPSAV